MRTRRVVLLTLALTLAVVIVLVAGVGGALGWKREHDKRVRVERQMKNLEAEAAKERAAAKTSRAKAKGARRQANIFARHIALQADDDGYRVSVCSGFSNVNVYCSAHNWGYRAKEGYEYDCYYTVVIRLTATTINRSQRNNRCYTH